jgi:FAD/FMN-containing dehydrogenase
VSNALFDRLRLLLGPEGVERDPRGLARAVPESDDALALVCQAAQDEGWRFRLEGRGSWLPPDAPADFALSTRGLDRLVSLSPEDLVATVQAGMTMEALRAELASRRLWLALDPPGRPDRTIGSVVATGTAGPLRQGYGPVRDHVLGLTVATGDGRLVTAGGRVVKNVAGYDLTKLHVGGFGAFGAITELHLRLRAEPEANLTLLASGGRHALVDAGRQLVEARVDAAAMQLLAPAWAALPEWSLAVRLIGAEAGVRAEAERVRVATGLAWTPLSPDRDAAFWSLVARAPLGGTAVLRLGALLDGIDDAIDLLVTLLSDGLVSAGLGNGSLRWAGDATADAIRQLRHAAATREIPLTLERAPWTLRRAVGHFGAYHEGVGQLVGRLRETFDPKKSILVALEESET